MNDPKIENSPANILLIGSGSMRRSRHDGHEDPAGPPQPGGPLMEEDGFDWRSFWDLASPDKMVPVLLELYGTDADSAVAQCILTASADGRDEDRRFWLAVASGLRSVRQPKDLNQERQP